MNQEYESHPDDTLNSLLKSIPAEKRREIMQEEPESRESFSQALDAAGRSPSSLLSREERAYFFGNPSHSVADGIKEPEMDRESMYDQAILDPALKSTRVLMYANLSVLALLLLIVAGLGYQQFRLNALVMNTQSMVMRRGAEAGEDKPAFSWSTLANMSWEQQQKALGGILESPLTQKDEKIFACYLLAALAFENGNYDEGREYLVQGVKLRRGES